MVRNSFLRFAQRARRSQEFWQVYGSICGTECRDNWQFYFGAVWDLPYYELGDRIAWAEVGATFGPPSMTLVYALAYSVSQPACDSCGTPTIIAELIIRDCVLKELTAPRAIYHTRELLYEGEERKPRYHSDLYT